MKNILAALAAFFVAFSPIATYAGQPVDLKSPLVVAEDVTQTLSGMNPQSTWINQAERDHRVGEGTYWWNAIAASNASYAGSFANLSVVAVTGLYVAVGTTNANFIGTLYAINVDDANAFGGYPSGVGTYLAADPTKILDQAQLPAGTTTASILTTAGSSSGQSVDNLIECQPNRYDTTSQTISVVSSGGSVTVASGNRDRVVRLTCQNKASSSSTTPTIPTVDSGWVAIGYVNVPYGTVTVTGTNITALTTQQFYGFAPGNGTGATAIDTSSTAQTKAGGLVVAYLCAGTACGSGATGDITASRTASSGAFVFGTNATSYLDYGVSTAGIYTFNGGGVRLATGAFNSSAYGQAAVSGDGGFARSSSTGDILIGGSSSDAQIDYGLTTAGVLTANKPFAVANSAGDGVSSSGTTSTTNITLNAAAFIAGNSNSTTNALAYGNALGSGDYTLVSSGGGSAAGIAGTCSQTQIEPAATVLQAMDCSGNNGFAGRVVSGSGFLTSGATSVGSGQVAINAGSGAMYLDAFTNTGNPFTFRDNVSTVISTINTSGTYAASDRRMKHNIHPIPYGLEQIEQLKPAAFNWNSDGSPGIGFIAQELKPILPECVSVIDRKKGFLGANYSCVVPVLTRAIQQQEAANRELRGEVLCDHIAIAVAFLVGLVFVARRRRAAVA